MGMGATDIEAVAEVGWEGLWAVRVSTGAKKEVVGSGAKGTKLVDCERKNGCASMSGRVNDGRVGDISFLSANQFGLDCFRMGPGVWCLRGGPGLKQWSSWNSDIKGKKVGAGSCSGSGGQAGGDEGDTNISGSGGGGGINEVRGLTGDVLGGMAETGERSKRSTDQVDSIADGVTGIGFAALGAAKEMVTKGVKKLATAGSWTGGIVKGWWEDRKAEFALKGNGEDVIGEACVWGFAVVGGEGQAGEGGKKGGEHLGFEERETVAEVSNDGLAAVSVDLGGKLDEVGTGEEVSEGEVERVRGVDLAVGKVEGREELVEEAEKGLAGVRGGPGGKRASVDGREQEGGSSLGADGDAQSAIADGAKKGDTKVSDSCISKITVAEATKGSRGVEDSGSGVGNGVGGDVT